MQKGVLSSKADEVARNGAHLRITSTRGFLWDAPLLFPVEVAAALLRGTATFEDVEKLYRTSR